MSHIQKHQRMRDARVNEQLPVTIDLAEIKQQLEALSPPRVMN